MKRLFKFKYPKLTIFAICIIAAYFIFKEPLIVEKISGLNELSYLGMFIAGLFFSFGFTTPFAIGFFLTAHPDSIVLAGLLGGFGAMLSDFAIFKIIKFSFMDEFNRLERTKPFKESIHMIKHNIKKKIRNYLLYLTAGFIIASPLPDELGVTMLAGLTHIRLSLFALISFVGNTSGILIILILPNL